MNNISRGEILSHVESIKLGFWEGQILSMDKKAFRRFRDHSLLDVVGVYVIYSTRSEEDSLYIGEGDDVRMRLKCHSSDMRFWDRVYIFTSERMNVAFSKNIEHKFILKAKRASRYRIINDKEGGLRKLGKEDEEHLQNHLENYYEMIGLIGFDLFQTPSKKEYVYKEGRSNLTLQIEDFKTRKVTLLVGSCIETSLASKPDLAKLGVPIKSMGGSLVETCDSVSIPVLGLRTRIFDKIYLSQFKNKNDRSLYTDLLVNG